MEDSAVLVQLSSLHKLFLDEDLSTLQEISTLTALKGERVSFQILYTGLREEAFPVQVQAEADPQISVTLRKVDCVPSRLPVRDGDDYYLRTAPGLYPDVLVPLEGGTLRMIPRNRHALYVTTFLPETLPAGTYHIQTHFDLPEGRRTKTSRLRS